MRPKNPYSPGSPQHEVFEEGAEAERGAPERPQGCVENSACTRASAKTMIGVRISQLQAEIDGLRSIAKFAEAMEGTPADEYLWKLVVGQRTV